jgi:hypothetical protein
MKKMIILSGIIANCLSNTRSTSMSGYLKLTYPSVLYDIVFKPTELSEKRFFLKAEKLCSGTGSAVLKTEQFCSVMGMPLPVPEHSFSAYGGKPFSCTSIGLRTIP